MITAAKRLLTICNNIWLISDCLTIIENKIPQKSFTLFNIENEYLSVINSITYDLESISKINLLVHTGPIWGFKIILNGHNMVL